MDSLIFISLIIIALTQMVKSILPSIKGWLTIIIALVVGVLVAIFGSALGLTSISIAQGIVAALAAIGITTAAIKASPSDGTIK